MNQGLLDQSGADQVAKAARADTLFQLLGGVIKQNAGFQLRESFRQEEREGQFAPLPDAYRDPRILKAIASLGISPEAVYTSQADALDWADAGLSPFLTTETASGKSLVFQLAALKKMLEDPDARILVLYPTRALNSDQLISWQHMMKAADLPAHKVGLLDGGVPYDSRLDVVRDARILIATPDIIHTWMLSDPQIKSAEVQNFIRNIRLRVIDEAHVNDGVYGTKFSYLMRRLSIAQRLLNPQVGSEKEYWENYGQIIAASATISGPQDFLHALTGLPKDDKTQQIVVISPEEDGSPRKARQILRVATPHRKTVDLVHRYLAAVKAHDDTAKSIVFVDSRKQAETIAKSLNDMLGAGFAASYKSGYTREARIEIEDDFRNPESRLRVLVATSAAEVGINMLPVQNVINVGIPAEASSMMQRAGRIRQGGLVMFIERQGKDVGVKNNAIHDAFSKPPKHPRLYRTNEGIQAQMLTCLLDEMGNLTERAPTLAEVRLSTWPKSFTAMAKSVIDGERTIADIIHRKVPGNTVPQRYFSLRDADAGRARVVIYVPALSKTITLEELSHLQALNEAYPGATMLHRGNYYRISRWNTPANNNHSAEILIHARIADGETLTRAFMKSALMTNLYYDPKRSGVQHDKIRIGELNRGDFLASTGFTVRTTVGGFTEFGQGVISAHTKLGAFFYGATQDLDDKHPFKDLEAPPAYKSWYKGVLMRVQERWFHAEARKILGQAIIDEYAKRNRLSTRDFTLYTDHIEAKYSAHYGYTGEAGQMMAICENSRSDFGLATGLYKELPAILIHLASASDNDAVKRLAMLAYQWNLSLKEVTTPSQDEAARIHLKPSTPQAIQCFLPGSIVMKTPNRGAAKAELVKIKSVEVVAGQVLYKYVAMNGEADIGVKTKRGEKLGEDFDHALPAKCFGPEQGYWYSYGTIDVATGALTTAEHEDTSRLLEPTSAKAAGQSMLLWQS